MSDGGYNGLKAGAFTMASQPHSCFAVLYVNPQPLRLGPVGLGSLETIVVNEVPSETEIVKPLAE
jgi:hypothetical protein